MSYYNADRLILAVEPIDLTSEDIALLTMEKNPMDALRYFVSVNNDPPRFKSKLSVVEIDAVPQETVSDKDLAEADGAVFAKFIPHPKQPKFLYVNLLKTSGWVCKLAGISYKTVSRHFNADKFNAVWIDENNPSKGRMIIPDEKLHNFLKERQSMTTPTPASATKITSSSSKYNLHDKVLSVIKSGVVGGIGESVSAEVIYPYLVQSYPSVGWTRGNINSALATLRRHGDLVRVPILDRFGNPTKSFARGKYHINTKAAVNHPAVVHPVVPPVPNPVVHHPMISTVSNDELKLGGSKASLKNSARVAFENFIKNHMKDGYVAFTIEDIAREYPDVPRHTISLAVSNATRPAWMKKLLRNHGKGRWEYRNDESIAWPNWSGDDLHVTTVKTKTVSEINSKLDVDKIAAELLKQGIPLSKVIEMVGKL